jgi:hypothetical protein
MNVITSTDGRFLMSCLSADFGGLEGLRSDLRLARRMLDLAKLDVPIIHAYRGADLVEFRGELARRLRRCRRRRDEAAAAIKEVEQANNLRRFQEAQPAGLNAKQVAYCIKVLGTVESWLDRLSLTKPADNDYHARILMRDQVTGVRDLLLNASVQSVSILN